MYIILVRKSACSGSDKPVPLNKLGSPHHLICPFLHIAAHCSINFLTYCNIMKNKKNYDWCSDTNSLRWTDKWKGIGCWHHCHHQQRMTQVIVTGIIKKRQGFHYHTLMNLGAVLHPAAQTSCQTSPPSLHKLQPNPLYKGENTHFLRVSCQWSLEPLRKWHVWVQKPIQKKLQTDHCCERTWGPHLNRWSLLFNG